MVSPFLRSSASASSGPGPSQSGESAAQAIVDMLPRLHVLVIGPGLGRDAVTLGQVASVIKAARSKDPPVPMVLDADCLFLIQAQPDLVRGYRECILTPNVVEFARLAKAVHVDVQPGDRDACERLATAMGGVCIIQKGPVDNISNGEGTAVCDLPGGRKRSGGQGDTLTGSLGTFLAWRQAYHDGLWDAGDKQQKMSRTETLLVAAFAGSAITRECSRRAFEKKGRSMQAGDLTDEVHGSFLALVGEPEGSKL